MIRVPFPGAGEQIEVSTSNERSYTTWVDQSDGRYMSVFAPHDLLVVDLPGTGSDVIVRWHSERGRHHVETVFVERRGDGGLQWVLEIEGDLRITQDREFVRGAGGEDVTLVRVEPEATTSDTEVAELDRDPVSPVTGSVVDLSERGMRARFETLDVAVDDVVVVTLSLDEGLVNLTGTVLRLFPASRGAAPEVVVIFTTDDATATLLRRYVLQCQLRARRAAAD